MSRIEWTDATWNPVVGCSRVSKGCEHCYAERVAHRGLAAAHRGLTVVGKHGPRWTGEVRFLADRLAEPLSWRKPRRVFVNSMSDLFHEGVSDEQIAAVFGVMARAPQHTYQVLTKRPARARELLDDDRFIGEVNRQGDALGVREETARMVERQLPVPGYPGYFVTNTGKILSAKRGDLHEMRPDVGEQGHMRVQLHRDESGPRGDRHLVHRLVLEVFVGPAPTPGAQGCHRDGDASNNALPNLRWGSQSENWLDRKRHGEARSYAKIDRATALEIGRLHRLGHPAVVLAQRFGITDTQVRNIVVGRQWGERPAEWPLSCVWLGVSVEDQETADERIPLLLETPAAVRFVSYEPALGPVTLDERDLGPVGHIAATFGNPLINWVIVGGESGPGARPFDLAWARSVVARCRESAVPCFVKQLGARPLRLWDEDVEQVACGCREAFCPHVVPAKWRRVELRDRKGATMAEWPADLRVRECPAVRP